MSAPIARFARRIWRRAAASSPVTGRPSSAENTVALDEEFLRRLERLSLLVRRPAAGGTGGEHRGAARAPSTDFADYREYQPGDDFRRIDWNAYGRLGSLYVKLTEAREQVVVDVLLDASASMNCGAPSKFLYGRQLTAALAYLALARYDRVGVTVLGAPLEEDAASPRRFAPARGRRRFHDLLRFLEAVTPAGGLHLDSALAEYRPERRRGQAILISDMLAPDGYQDGLERLVRSGLDVVLLHLLSPQELQPAPGGDLELVDAETGELVEATLTEHTIRTYRERLDRWCAEVEAFCARRGIRYVRATTDTPFDTLLIDTLRRRLILH